MGDLERLEEQWIEELYRSDLPVAVRAVAFRSIVELRQCTAREVATYFSVDAAVVVRGLSLLESPADSKASHVAAMVVLHHARPQSKAA